jgi:transposase
LRLGLCGQFVREPIKFCVTTATAMLRQLRPAQLADLWWDYAEALLTSWNSARVMASVPSASSDRFFL